MNTIDNDFQEPVFINNAGLIILHPFLSVLFERSGLARQNKFKDEGSKSKAVHLLEYAVTGKTGIQEYAITLNKILCGMSVSDPINENIYLNEEDKELVNDLLGAVIKQWSKLGHTSIDGLRASFLQREGRLEEIESQYHLRIENKAFDMLLDFLPWNISIIRSNWMNKTLNVEWR